MNEFVAKEFVANKFLVAPSLLSADFSRLAEEIRAVEEAGADWLHVDVMDGHFVPNLTIGAPVVKSLRPCTKKVLDVHLMIEKPEKFIDEFVAAGSDVITIHVEATSDPAAVIARIRKAGRHPGITLRPQTPVEEILPLLSTVDLVLIMTVSPGFGGQSFMREQIKKIDRVAAERKKLGLEFLIEVDGGINAETAAECRGADVLVAGNYVFKNNIFGSDYKKSIQTLKAAKGSNED